MKRIGPACCLFLAFLLTTVPPFARRNPSPVPAFDGLLGLQSSYLREESDPALRAVETPLKTAKTGKMGDGKIFLSRIEDSIRIRNEVRGGSPR